MLSKIYKVGFEIEGEWTRRAEDAMRALGGSFKMDGSIRECDSYQAYHRNHPSKSLEGNELNSRPYTRREVGAKTLKFFTKLDELYKAGEFHWNTSCGFHIHVSFKPKQPEEIFSVQFYQQFINAMRRKFPAALANREDNHYCRVQIDSKAIMDRGDRYHAVNFTPAMQKHGTIEFRIFPSNRPLLMFEFLKFTVQFIDKFLASAAVSEHLEIAMDEITQENSRDTDDEATRSYYYSPLTGRRILMPNEVETVITQDVDAGYPSSASTVRLRRRRISAG